MAIVTDGLDQSTLVGYCAKLAAIQAQLDAVYSAAEGNESRFARYALGNALIALGESRGFLDQARDELLHEEDCDGDEEASVVDRGSVGGRRCGL